MAAPLDPRITPIRPGVAALSLKGQVKAERFLPGRPAQVCAPVLSMWAQPEEADLTTQLVFGETVTVFDEDADAGVAWVQNAADKYVGYVRLQGLSGPEDGEARVVHTRTGQLYAADTLKSTPLLTLPQLAVVRVVNEANGWAKCADGRYIPAGQIAPAGPLIDSFVAFAAGCIGVPYVWGGRSVLGLDCSALVQLSLWAAGRRCPRDSDMQQALGSDVDAELTRGDLIFWPGHVGIMINSVDMVHANAHHMSTVIEALANAERRIAGTDGPIIARRRLDLTKLPLAW